MDQHSSMQKQMFFALLIKSRDSNFPSTARDSNFIMHLRTYTSHVTTHRPRSLTNVTRDEITPTT